MDTLLAFSPELLLALGGFSLKEIIIGIAGFVVAFGLAVFIHELGHFLGAKMFGVPVERFVIGFDKEAMGFLPRCIVEKKIGETTYGLSLVPLGGYVKMSGVVHPDIERYLEGEPNKDQPQTVAVPPRPDGARPQPKQTEGTPSLQEQAMGDMAALYKKPFWQKVIIYGAGVVMNLILAMALYVLMFAKGFEDSAPYDARIGWFPETSTFASSPLQPGDKILRINGKEVANSDDINAVIFEAVEGTPLDQLETPVPLVVDLMRANPEPDEPAAYSYELELTNNAALARDFFQVFFRRDAYIDFVTPNSPAAKGGMKRSDVVTAIDGQRIHDWGHFVHIVSRSPNKELTIEVARGEKTETLKITPWEHAEQAGVGQVGVVVGNAMKVTRQEPLLLAMMNAPVRVWNLTTTYVSKLGELGGKVVQGNVKAASRELSGPAGIAQVAYKMSQHGFDDWLRFCIILNVALAVMNILPFPVLDGGHICFALYEAIFRRPVPPKVLVPLLNGAVMFILVFFVLVTFNDFWKIFF